jgi:hypothetical protein
MESEELIKAKEKKAKLEKNRFKQQTLPAWRPVPTLMSSLITFLVFGVIFLTFGIVLIEFTKDIVEVEKRYDSSWGNAASWTITLEIKEKMKQPVMVYYQLDNFYQNHRRYVKSVNFDQLSGSSKSTGSLTSWDPIISNSDLGFNLSYTGVLLDPTAAANPCGLIARSFFNDTYIMSGNTIDETDIAWDSDVDEKFGLPSDSATVQWIKPTDEHFIVWMRTAGMPSFRKLWGRIRTDIAVGNYTVTIANTYDVSAYDGKKTFVLSTTNAFGGKNYFLSIWYLVVGSLCFIFAAIFAIAHYVNAKFLKNVNYAKEGNNHIHAE